MVRPKSADYNGPIGPVEANEGPSPFMKLPAELRITIYQHYFDSLHSNRLRKNSHSITKFRPYLALLHASSQVRPEAVPIFYKDYMANKTAKDWLGWALVTKDQHTVARRLKSIAQSLAEHSPDIKVSIRFSILVEYSNTTQKPVLSASFVDTLLQHIYSQVPYQHLERRSLRREYGKYRARWVDYFGSNVGLRFQFNQTVGGFTVGYICKWLDDFYHETFEFDGPLAQIDWSDSKLD